MIAASCLGEETQKSFFVSSLSHSLCFTGVQGRFLALLEMTIRGNDGMRRSGILISLPPRASCKLLSFIFTYFFLSCDIMTLLGENIRRECFYEM